jgi:hypothetical protein
MVLREDTDDILPGDPKVTRRRRHIRRKLTKDLAHDRVRVLWIHLDHLPRRDSESYLFQVHFMVLVSRDV